MTFSEFYDEVGRRAVGRTWQVMVKAWGHGKRKVVWEIYVEATAEQPALSMPDGRSSGEEALATLDHYLRHARDTYVGDIGAP